MTLAIPAWSQVSNNVMSKWAIPRRMRLVQKTRMQQIPLRRRRPWQLPELWVSPCAPQCVGGQGDVSVTLRVCGGGPHLQTAHPATSRTAPAHQRRGSANAETTPARAPQAQTGDGRQLALGRGHGVTGPYPHLGLVRHGDASTRDSAGHELWAIFANRRGCFNAVPGPMPHLPCPTPDAHSPTPSDPQQSSCPTSQTEFPTPDTHFLQNPTTHAQNTACRTPIPLSTRCPTPRTRRTTPHTQGPAPHDPPRTPCPTPLHPLRMPTHGCLVSFAGCCQVLVWIGLGVFWYSPHVFSHCSRGRREAHGMRCCPCNEEVPEGWGCGVGAFRPGITGARVQRVGARSAAPFWEGQEVKQAPMSAIFRWGHWCWSIWAGVSPGSSAEAIKRRGPRRPFSSICERSAVALWAQRGSVFPANNRGPARSHWGLGGGEEVDGEGNSNSHTFVPRPYPLSLTHAHPSQVGTLL